MSRRSLILLITTLISLAACQSQPASPVQTSSALPVAVPPTENLLPSPISPTLAESIGPSPTPLLSAVDTPFAASAPLPITPTADPLRFVLPEQGAVPVSAWRPPLYPTPWAPTPYDHFFFTRPIAADQVNWPLADYRYGGVFLPGVVHTGVDIPAPYGTPVLAAGSGKITWAGYGLYELKEDPNDPYGLAIAIRHDFGYEDATLYTVYGHLSKIFVTKGQNVEAGEVIGLVGDTGKTTGVHLHFEVRLQKNNFYGSRNPELWVVPPQGWGVLAARVLESNGLPLESQSIIVHNLERNQYWEVKTYGKGMTNSDPYYNENMVMGDLPAGDYEIWIDYKGTKYNLPLEIKAGLVAYFTFRGRRGFSTALPPIPGADFSPDFNATPPP